MEASSVRKFALIGFIVLVLATLVFLFLSKQFVNKIKNGGKFFTFGLLACGALVLSMVFLAVHLLWH